MLRAVRYEQRYDFTIGVRTLELLIEAKPLIDRVSGDRIRHELDRIIEETKATNILDRLFELGVLAAIHPDLHWDEWLRTQFKSIPETSPDVNWELDSNIKGIPFQRAFAYTLWLIRLTLGQANAVIKRLKLPRVLATTARAACELWGDLPKLKNSNPSTITSRLEKVPALSLFAAHEAIIDSQVQDLIRRYVTDWKFVRPHSTGKDLQSRDIPPGPRYKTILDTLRDAWLDGEVKTIDQEMTYLERLLSDG
jgi:tRNA nucleotidyltransferase (CCA-adding enzyme)